MRSSAHRVIKHQIIAVCKILACDADNPVCPPVFAGTIACITFLEETICRALNTQTRL